MPFKGKRRRESRHSRHHRRLRPRTRRHLHPDFRADYVLANRPFNDYDWFRKDDDARLHFGVPANGNANFARVQHFIDHLAAYRNERSRHM